MSTYKELKEKINLLQQQAEDARKAESAKVISDIKALIADFDIKPNDIFPDLRISIATNQSRPPRKNREIKYSHPSGEVWSGGPGRKPKWVRDVEESGESIEKYAVKK